MKKEFVPYEQALELKKLGFNEPCYAYFSNKYTYVDTIIKPIHVISENINESALIRKLEITCLSPTFSKAFRWFREKYNLIPDIQYYGNWNFEIFRIGEFAEPMDDVNVDYTFKGGTYEEAELECLKKLIEIIKNK